MKEKIIMNKKISLLLFAAIVIASLSVFSVPASADTPTLLSEGSSIYVNDNYSEYCIMPTSGSSTYTFPLYVSDTGNYIIQSFGPRNESPKIALLNPYGATIINQNSAKTKGYNGNSFLQYDFSSDSFASHMLRVTVSSSSPVRISITRADGLFEVNPPISECEDIVIADTVTADFYVHSSAVVFTFVPEQTRSYTVHSEGSDTMKVYFMDPTTNTCYDAIVSTGECDVPTATLTEGSTYYVVMYQPVSEYGEFPSGIELEYVTLTVAIV